MMVRSCSLLLLPLLGGCTVYVEDAVDPAKIADEAAQRPGGTFTLQIAFAAALEHSPALRAAEARARAAGAVVQPLTLEAEYRSDTDMLAVMLDPIAVLGLGPRGAADATADATATQAAVALVEERWRVLGQVAEAFAVDAALLPLTSPTIPTRIDDYRAAGLAAPVAAARLDASVVAAEAEFAALTRERIANLAGLRSLLGLPAAAPLELEHGDQPWRTFTADDAELLRRPDLALAHARWQVADAEFRQAVADQYPSLMVGPEVPLLGGPLEAMAVLRLPLLQHGLAASARERRDAARAELLGAYLRVAAEVTETDANLRAASAIQRAAAAQQQASERALRAALVAVEVEVDAFAMLAEAASMAVEDTRMLREASLAAARAAVRSAIAHGWPAAATEERS